MKIPKTWRQGQFIFNFLEWLRTEKGLSENQSYRMADIFHISDEDLNKYLKEYQAMLEVKLTK